MRTGYKREIWEFGSSREVEEKHTGNYGARGQKREKKRKPTKEEITKQNQWKREREWEFGSSREVEEKHTGNYGARGQKREKKRKPTKEEITKQNQWKRERDVRRLIKWNFTQNDYWMTITYKKGERPSTEEMKKDMEILIRKVRAQYRKAGKELKYICRMGIGKRGGPHMHILVNRFATEETATDLIFSRIGKRGGPHMHILVNRFATEETATDLIFSRIWTKGHVNFKTTYDAGGYRDLRGGPHMHILVNRFATEETATDLIFSRIWTKGHVNFKTTYDAGGYRDLAEYITKPLEAWEEECIKRYSRSRNLISKDPEEKIINRRSLVDPKGNMIQPKAPRVH